MSPFDPRDIGGNGHTVQAAGEYSLERIPESAV